MKTLFLSKAKIKELESSIGWLSNYIGPNDGETHIVGESLDGNEEKNTELLKTLGEINKERAYIIKRLTK